MMTKRFLTLKESADWLGISYAQVWKLARSGMLDVRNHGVKKKLMVSISSLESFSAGRVVEPVYPSLSKFQAAKERVRSLTSQNPPKLSGKGA